MLGNDAFGIISQLAIQYPAFLFSLCFHEYAHGWWARRCGDRTAELAGRLTLDPIAHMDPIGTFLLPIIGMASNIPMFGWAKPVPVDERNLRNPKNDMFWVAFAGPISNVVLAFIGTALLALAWGIPGIPGAAGIQTFLQYLIMINLALAIFNLIPVHPLDGGKVLGRFLPYQWNRYMEDNQMMISMALMAFMWFGGLFFLSIPIRFFAGILLNLAQSGASWI